MKKEFEIYYKAHDSEEIETIFCITETEDVVEQMCDILSKTNPNGDYWYGDGK